MTTPAFDTWEYLPFRSDTATDFVLSIQERLVDEVDAVLNDDERLAADITGNGTLVPSLVLLADFSERHDIFLPIPADVVEMWQDLYMESFEGADLPPAFARPRRFLLEKTFATLMEHATMADRIFAEATAGDDANEAD